MTRLLRRTSEGTACQPECSLTRSEDGGLAARGAWIGNRVQVPGLLGAIGRMISSRRRPASSRWCSRPFFLRERLEFDDEMVGTIMDKRDPDKAGSASTFALTQGSASTPARGGKGGGKGGGRGGMGGDRGGGKGGKGGRGDKGGGKGGGQAHRASRATMRPIGPPAPQ